MLTVDWRPRVDYLDPCVGTFVSVISQTEIGRIFIGQGCLCGGGMYWLTGSIYYTFDNVAGALRLWPVFVDRYKDW